MQTAKIIKLGLNKGAPRAWFEGRNVARAGFEPGNTYSVDVVPEKGMVALRVVESGARVVSKKMRGDKEVPVIDLNSREVLGLFEGMESIRVIMADRVIYLLPLATEVRKKERIDRLRAKIETGEPIAVGSLNHGGGILSNAIHHGLRQSGVKSKLAFANDIDMDVLSQAQIHNEAWGLDTVYVGMPMQELAFDEFTSGKLPKVDLLEAGIPCSAHSVAARAKKQTVHPEDDPLVGHLVVAFLSIIAKVNPSMIVLENVQPYQSSASMSIIRNQLSDMGYKIHERILNASDWNCLENRVRMCMVATTDGIDFDFESLLVPVKQSRRLGEILEDISPEDPSWRSYAHLKAKESRDAEKGNSFAMQFFTPDSTGISTLRKFYAKAGSSDPLLRHPTNPDLSRQLTAVEHARCKGIPAHLTEGMSKTAAHELLGQSIAYPPFVAVGELIGRTIHSWAASAHQEPLAA